MCVSGFVLTMPQHTDTWMTVTQQLTSYSLLDFVTLSKTLSDLKFYLKLFYKRWFFLFPWWKYYFVYGPCSKEILVPCHAEVIFLLFLY